MDRKIVLLLPLLIGVQCTGTETENPLQTLVSFHGSACKSMPPIVGKGLPPPDGGSLTSDAGQTPLLDSSYDGLQCIAWQRLSSGSYRFELGNFPESCGIDNWKGGASIAVDGSIALHAVNTGCLATRCLPCLYDWSFDVRGVPEDKDAHLLVSVVDDDGTLCQTGKPPYDVTIPSTDAEQGVRCRLADHLAVVEEAYALGSTGMLNMPCGADAINNVPATPCAAELSCGPLASPDDLRCLARCSNDSDCPLLPGLLTCQEGTCRLAQTW